MQTPRWKQRPSGANWGDFGPDDQIGRMNLLTPAIRLQAMREVRQGLAFCLSLPLDYPGGNALFRHRKAPRFFHERRGDGHNYNYRLANDCACLNDVVSDEGVMLYTQYSTQWDGLGHVGQMFDADGDGVPEKVYYNGFRAGTDLIGPDDLVAQANGAASATAAPAPDGAAPAVGAKAIGIERMAAAGVQGRGVLVDLEKIHGRERALIGCEALLAALQAQRITLRPGDFLCLYTGFADLVLALNKRPDGPLLARSCAVLDGRDTRLLQWISDSGLVAICADNFAVEAYPARPPDGAGAADGAAPACYPGLPLHNHCLFKLGLHLGELWYFAELAQWLRANARNSFLLTAPPLRLPGAVGSPVTPVATV